MMASRLYSFTVELCVFWAKAPCLVVIAISAITTDSSNSLDSKIFFKWRLTEDKDTPNNVAISFCVIQNVSSLNRTLVDNYILSEGQSQGEIG